MCRILLPTVLLVLITLVADAQPGYMGKRLVPYYEGAFMNAIFSPNVNHKSLFKDHENPEDSKLHPLAFNYRNILGLDIVIGRLLVIGADIQYYKTAIHAKDDFKIDPLNRVNFNEIIDLKGTNYELYLKRFWDGYIAPAGFYVGGGVLLAHVQTADPDRVYYYQDAQTGKKESFTFDKNSLWTPGLTTEVGITRIVANRIMLRLALDFSVLYSYLYTQDKEWLNQNNYIRSQAGLPISLMHLFNIKVGAGILADVREFTQIH